MTTGQGAKSGVTKLSYHVIRNLTSPEEKANGVQTWFANLDASNIVGVSTQDNLRTYIAEHSSAKRNAVHRQIQSAIENLPDRFINRNSGITITCTSCDVDDTKKTVTLKNASIINGAQTQGEIARYYQNAGEEGVEFPIRVEIIMEPAHDQIVEIAIARNTATAVKSVSQSAARGHLDDLKAAIEKGLPGETIQMRETDLEGINTQSILQWSRLLMPQKVLKVARNFAYKQGGKCLTDFSQWAEDAPDDPDAKALYNFTVQIAPTAVKEYRHWESHDGWNGHRLHEKGKHSDRPHGGRPVRRDATGKVDWVAPGILFPVLSALSAFVTRKNGKWVLEKPKAIFSEDDLIYRAVQQFRGDTIDRQVALMGRSDAAYDALSIYTETIATVIAQQK